MKVGIVDVDGRNVPNITLPAKDSSVLNILNMA